MMICEVFQNVWTFIRAKLSACCSWTMWGKWCENSNRREHYSFCCIVHKLVRPLCMIERCTTFQKKTQKTLFTGPMLGRSSWPWSNVRWTSNWGTNYDAHAPKRSISSVFPVFLKKSFSRNYFLDVNCATIGCPAWRGRLKRFIIFSEDHTKTRQPRLGKSEKFLWGLWTVAIQPKTLTQIDHHISRGRYETEK